VNATALRANNDDSNKEKRRKNKGIDIHSVCGPSSNFSAVVAPMLCRRVCTTATLAEAVSPPMLV